MSQGNLGIAHVYIFNGDPTNISTKIFDAPPNSIVIDSLNQVIRFKLSPKGNNSSFQQILTSNQ